MNFHSVLKLCSYGILFLLLPRIVYSHVPDGSCHLSSKLNGFPEFNKYCLEQLSLKENLQSFLFKNDSLCLKSKKIDDVYHVVYDNCEKNKSGLSFTSEENSGFYQFKINIDDQQLCLASNEEDYAILTKCSVMESNQNFRIEYSPQQDSYQLYFLKNKQKFCLDYSSKQDGVFYTECEESKTNQNLILSLTQAMKEALKNVIQEQKVIHLGSSPEGMQLALNSSKNTIILEEAQKDPLATNLTNFKITGKYYNFNILAANSQCLSLSKKEQLSTMNCQKGDITQSFALVPLISEGKEILVIQSRLLNKCFAIADSKLVLSKCEDSLNNTQYLTLTRILVENPNKNEAPSKHLIDPSDDDLEIPPFSTSSSKEFFTLVNDFNKLCLKKPNSKSQVLLGPCGKKDQKFNVLGNEQSFIIKNKEGSCLTTPKEDSGPKTIDFQSCNNKKNQLYSLKRTHILGQVKLKIINQGKCLDIKSLSEKSNFRELNIKDCNDNLLAQYFHFYEPMPELKLEKKLEALPLASKIKNLIDQDQIILPNKPNIFFIFMDSLRFDHINMNLGPALTAFASSANFYKGIAGATSTEHSLFSMLYSEEGFYADPYKREKWELGPPSLVYLKKKGYTINVFGNTEWYFNTAPEKIPNEQKDTPDYQFNVLLFGKDSYLLNPNIATFAKDLKVPGSNDSDRGKTDQNTIERFQIDINARDIDQLKKEGGQIFFLMLAGCHQKYYPYIDPYKKQEGKYFDEFYQYSKGDNVHQISDIHEQEKVRNLYKNTVIGFDAQFNNIISYLKEKNLYDDSIIVFFSDHGEALFDKGEYSHGGESLTVKSEVPVIIKFPDSMKSPRNQGLAPLPLPLKNIFPTLIKSLVPDYSTTAPAMFLKGKAEGPLEKEKNCHITTRANGKLSAYEFTVSNEKYKVVLQMQEKELEEGKGTPIHSDSFFIKMIRDHNDHRLILSKEEKKDFFFKHFKDCLEEKLNIKFARI